MGRSIEGRIETLEGSTPRGYTTYDGKGRTVIQSDLPGLEWMRECERLFHSRREAAKAELSRQLATSVGPDNAGGHLYQLVAAIYCGPLVEEKR